MDISESIVAPVLNRTPSEEGLEDGKFDRWHPVSKEYPVHIRLVDGPGFELALYLDQLPPLGPNVRQGSDNRPVALVRRVLAAVQELLSAQS